MASLTAKLKGHRFQTLVNIAALLMCAVASSYLLLAGTWIGAAVLLSCAAVLIAVRMIHQIDRQQERFTQFIRNIAHDDFSTTTALQGDNAAADFLAAQQTLINKYKQLKTDKSVQHEYLHRVIEHVDTALLCFDGREKIVIANRAAKDLLLTPLLINMRQIDLTAPLLGDAMRSLRPGQSRLLKVVLAGETMQLLLAARDFTLLGNAHKLVSIQNIQAAIDETELSSWQKLIKVLTHEIMNSMTPIVSLSSHLQKTLSDDQEDDLVRGIRSIASRSDGLLKFIDSYRSLTSLPAPTASEIAVSQLFDHISVLTADRLSSSNCTFHTTVDQPAMTIVADQHQVEQILLNLITNAEDAVSDQPVRQIQLKGYVDNRRRPVIQVVDSGVGIPAEQLDNIFTPFFTTKETGTGVGLSLSRQLAHLNRATLDVHSEVNTGSTFTLAFEPGRLLTI